MSICQIYDLCADTLWLGRYGENGARDIAIDVGKWFADLGAEGTVVLVNWRPGEDDQPYNPNVTMDGSKVVWSPSNIDLAISGRGFAELRYYVGNALAKSKTFRTVIDRTPSEGAEPPSAAEDWLERMEDAAVTAQTASETAVTAAETATEGAQAVAQALPTVTQAAATATSAAATATSAATEAALSEEVASTAANAAQAASETATAASQTAVSASGTATTKAAQAVEAASTATTKASEAAQAATTATANAQTSTAKAEEATTAAATATSKATEATTAASMASAAATTASGAASTATTAAATATSAKTDAVAANTAAQSAKTAAQTAQTGAETAAASVSASAEQIETNKNDITELKADFSQLAKKRYMLDNPQKALFPEFVSKFWCSNVLPSALSGKQLVLTISGTEGDDHITPTAITPSDINISAITSETGVVLTTDSIEYEVYNIKYDSTTESLSIYPPLKQTVEDATLAQVYLDAGENYTAMHLTEHGYRAYVWFLYNQNPKHCEVGLYNASFNAMYDTTFPFNKFSGSSSTPLYLGFSTRNKFLYYLRNYYTRYFSASWSVGYTPYEQKNGIYWDVNLNGTSGYLELLMSVDTSIIDLPEGEELYVDVYIDGELAHREVITNAVGRRICVDYKNALTGRLEIYSNKWDAIGSDGKAICINKAVWWINELEYAENQKLFPTGSVVAMEFDSWGVFHDGVTGTALHDLINADAGCTVDFTNHSLGSQTTAWGMAYWYQNIKAYNPAIAITDFLINDTNSVTYSGFPDVIVGPDGKEYPNKITQDMYVGNIKKLIAYAVNNRIQPIVMRNTQITYSSFPEAVLNGISEQYTP